MRFLFSILAAMLAASAFGADAPAGPDRPRVALVLGGGGAKGAAYIGVLQSLEELRVPVDCIAGTSVGALLGGMYATGMSAKDIERYVLGIDWTRAVGGKGLRDRMPIDRKLTAQTYTNSIEFGIGDDGINAPNELIDTQYIEGLIWQFVADQQATDDFDDLPIPYRAVATDMVSGDMVVLGDGELAVAMRASMAVPGAFAPVIRGEQVLADGGMTRRLPIDVGRELCGDVVIAVWLESPNPTAAELESAVILAARSLDLMIDANEDRQKETLTATDVGIGVPMGDIHLGSFERIPEAIEFGHVAGMAARATLQRYAVSEEEYQAWRRSVGDSSADTFRLAEVRVVGTERVNPEYVRARLDDVEKGASLASDRITAYAQSVHALGDFERVEYRLSGPDAGRVLEIRPVEKSWGPDFLRFDVGLATQGDGDLRALLRVDHERTWINRRGGRWHNTVQIGRQTIVATDFYQPLDIGQRFFVQPILTFERNLEDLYVDGERGAQYFLNDTYGQFDVGINFDTRAQLRVGLRRGWQQAELDTGSPDLPELERTADTSVQYRFIFDTRNQVALPTDGVFLNARYMQSEDWFGGDLDYRIWEGVLVQAFEFRGNSLRFILGGGNTIEGEPPLSRTIQLGGIRTFPGLRPGELRGENYWLAGTGYSWRLADLQPVFGQAVYAGLRLQAAEVGERYDGIDDGTLWGLSGSISGLTPVGPFILSLGYVDNDSWRFQFSLGRPMTEGSLLDEIY